ncbi:MAG TPA: winged helix DNA-binding domain-containing protein [Candidatus Dormibacteraeota bacterium]|nr:winged helix DNA-binding domain-containing protein [Candidatus Dormibacteraeota bacterium]
MPQIVAARLRAQRLDGPAFAEPVDVVRHFGAVQSQDYPGAKWALGLRLERAADADLDRAYDEGSILRTHVLRPTWHFVAPEDIRWMLALTGPRIHRSMASRFRNLELDAPTIRRAQALFEKALSGGQCLTRVELGEVLSSAGIAPDGQRLPHLLMVGELSGLLTSGPRKGKLLSYALLEERVPRARVLDDAEAVAELAQRYFVSHGPATLRDFVWWSGLTQAEARRGVADARGILDPVEVDGVEHWFDARLGTPRTRTPAALLLPNFDEYTVGYADRAALMHPERPFRPELFAFSSVLSNVLVIGGTLAGAWRRVAARDGVRIEVRPLAKLDAAEQRLVERAAERYSRFLGLPARVVWL